MNLKNLPQAFWICAFVFLLSNCKTKESATPDPGSFQILAGRIGSYTLNLTDNTKNMEAPSNGIVSLDFSIPLDSISAKSQIQLLNDAGSALAIRHRFLEANNTVSLQPLTVLENGKSYSIRISNQLIGVAKETFPGITIGFSTPPASLKPDSISIDGRKGGTLTRLDEIGNHPVIKVWFSNTVDASTINSSSIFFYSKEGNVAYSTSLSTDKRMLTIIPTSDLSGFTRFTLQISAFLKGIEGQSFSGITQNFYTKVDASNKFPLISDEDLMTLVQHQTFKYFWDFAHPVCGLASERNTSPETVTTGGSGFGIMALIVGVERGFITRSQAIERWTKIVSFLKKANRFHGAWPHWMYGTSGKVQPFSTNDNGGDLVETAFMVQGLITVRQYLNGSDTDENKLKQKIDSVCNEVEWDWYRQNNQNVLYWHWSPSLGWVMNHQLRGWNETLITYVMAASSTTHSIPKSVYSNGFASNGGMANGQTYLGFPLPLGSSFGGPLFFAHYSFLGLNPTNLSDVYANYWTQNVNHTKINNAYCISNPRKYVGYSSDCWGLTASDNQVGYNAHSPTNDLGVITPTAALSSFPYTPVESMKAMKFFYYKLGDRAWGPYGFYDAFNPTEDWYGRSYLAIDQGPIVVMMENHRTGLLWNLFMSAPEVQAGLTKLGFTY